MRKANNGEVLDCVLGGITGTAAIRRALSADPSAALGRLVNRGIIKRVAIGEYRPDAVPHCRQCGRSCVPLTGLQIGAPKTSQFCSSRCANAYCTEHQKTIEGT